jgi:hypothetical protein
MASFKNVNGDYTLTCADGTGTFTVNANLVVLGTTTNTTPSTSVAPFITVAANNTGTLTDMGLLAQLNANTFAGFRYDVPAQRWQVSSSVDALGNPVLPYANVATGDATVAGSNTQIQFNNGSGFGASANLAFDYGNNSLLLNGYQVFGNNATPANVANSVALYSNAVGSGGTGLYFTSSSAQDELVSKAKAIVYSIIF